MSVLTPIVFFMIIDCDTCTMRDIACKECVVSFLIDTPFERRKKGRLDEEETRVIDLLASRGLVPPLRYAENQNSQAHEAASG
ncbi:MAG: hypothetical protein KJS67_02710 [Actinomycetales bacterium]|jgi:hypothetical protein|nr:hypothetical protein [Actinomycetales bacterium]